MLSCQNCETPQFLQITSSHTKPTNDSVATIEETVECTFCGAEGDLEYDLEGNAIDVSGDLENTDDGPLSEPDAARLITDGGQPIEESRLSILREYSPALAFVFLYVIPIVILAALIAYAVISA
ncbi:hypothetical protein [Natrinema sp. DC36]|uniref:hypothetical protein n=1 Tax=Natrinema sp. DC36 TaxID=2878680 RepID=UPI001CF092B4|nr:hypothetical protein [Natrinema sp. DC36]